MSNKLSCLHDLIQILLKTHWYDVLMCSYHFNSSLLLFLLLCWWWLLLFCYFDDIMSVDGDADAAVEAVHKGWNKFRQLVLPITNTESHFLWEGNYAEVVCIVVYYMAVKHGQWRKENKLTLQQAEMWIIRCMCGIKVRFTCSELREAREQHRLRWCGHALRKDENDWVNKKQLIAFTENLCTVLLVA